MVELDAERHGIRELAGHDVVELDARRRGIRELAGHDVVEWDGGLTGIAEQVVIFAASHACAEARTPGDQGQARAMLAGRRGLDLWRPAQDADTKGQRQEPDALLLSSKRRPAVDPQAGNVRLVGR